MSLFGSLYSSVSGIQSQGTAIGIISDNISNVSTVGYKAGSQYFGTLVTNSGASVAYSPGGVRAQNRQLISQQGLLTTTSSPLDIAISGNGMFVTADTLNPDASISYTRAGSFRTDSLGNFLNGAGLYLKAWPLDENGNIPTNNASLDSLQIVNIGSASGDASATTKVQVGIKLDSAKAIFPGSGDIGTPGSDGINVENRGVGSNAILVPNANLAVGDDLAVTVNGGFTYNFVYGGFATSGDIAGAGPGNGPFFGASTAEAPFQIGAGLADGDSFTITRSGDSANPVKLTYVTSSPDASKGQFNSLETLAKAINATAGLSARVATVGSAVNLYVAADNAKEGLTFAQSPGSTADFPTVLGLATVPAVTTNRFASLDGLKTLMNEQTAGRLTATIGNPDQNATIDIKNTDPLATIQFANGATSDFLAELGLTSTVVPPSYDGSATSTTSMASGNIKPTFSRGIDVYDSLGAAHNLTIGFLKVANNQWKVEIYAKNGEIANGVNQIASGSVSFNNDGTLFSIDSALTTGISAISWANGAASPSLTFDFGTSGPIGTGLTDGLSQFAGSENVKFLTKNGAAAGLLDSVSIDKNGYIVANFNNGQTQRLYKIPLADFANPNGLINKNGNAFIQSYASGEVNLKEPGTGSVGSISPSALESANTELSEELTDMIVAQRAYQAASKVITTADRLLEELARIGS